MPRTRRPHPTLQETSPDGSGRRTVLLAVVLGAIAAYLLLFFATEMPSLSRGQGETFRRIEFGWFLVLPDELARLWFGEPAEFSLLDRLPILLIAATILAVATCAGRLLLAALRLPQRLTRCETLAFSAVVGLNLVSTYVLAAGLLGGLSRWVFVVPAVVVVATAAVLVCRLSQKNTGKASGTQRRWLWLAAPFVAIVVLGAMLPPVEFDVREYHLQAPKEFYQQGCITLLPHNVYANMPLGAEMLALLGMVVAGDWWLGALVGKTLIAAVTLLTSLGLYAAGQRFFSTAAGVVAAIVYLSVPWIVQVSTLGLIDGVLAGYLFFALYAMLLLYWPGQDAVSPPWSLVALSGYLAGAAAAVKYPAVLFVVVPLFGWLVVREWMMRRRNAWRPAAVFLLAVLLGCGLWYAKNLAFTGNPTYPLLYSVFGGETWSDAKNQQWNAAHRPHDFSPAAFAADAARVTLTSEWLSPIVIPLAAAAFLLPRFRRQVFLLSAYAVLFLAAWWLLTHRIDRFWLPVLPILALLAGIGATWSDARLWRRALVAILLLGTMWSFLAASTAGSGYHHYFVSLAKLRDDPAHLDPWHRYFNTQGPGTRVLLVGDVQPFDLHVPAYYSTCFDDSLFEQIVRDRSSDEIRKAFAERGITHVYVDWAEIARYRSSYGFTPFVEPEVFDRLVRESILQPLPPLDGRAGRAYRIQAGATDGVTRQ